MIPVRLRRGPTAGCSARSGRGTGVAGHGARRPTGRNARGARGAPWAPGRGTAIAVAALVAISLAVPDPARAQERWAVLEEPSGTAVGVAVLVNSGTWWEPGGLPGLAHLAARAIAEELRPRLETLEARVEVACDRAAIAWLLVAPPERWVDAATALLRAVLSPTVDDAAFARAKAELAAWLAAEEESPVLAARDALDRAFFGGGSPWSISPCGTPETFRVATAEEARRWARARFTPARTVAAVAGPVDAGEAEDLLERALSTLARPVPLPRPEPAPVGRDAGVRENVVSNWVAMAFPIRGGAAGGDGPPGGAETEAFRLLAHYLGEVAAPSAANADVLDARVEVERYGGGGALVVHLVTTAGAGAAWAARIANAVRELARATLPRSAFDPLVRRYRGARLLELAAPEARAHDAAAELLHGGEYLPPRERLRELTPELLRLAALRLGDPAVVTLSAD